MIAETEHNVYTRDAREAWPCASESVHLVVTSPPYPMIAMWDECFTRLGRPGPFQKETKAPIRAEAFEAMHQELDRVWARCRDALCEGGFLVINIGDATRTIDKRFRLFSNHARIIQSCTALGLGVLPGILWRKPTNAPNKFMGSGMLPGGAYVTLEHEHILIFRKGGKRAHESPEEKMLRRRSALFWEERNAWFSDIWQDIPGERQAFGGPASRNRSGAFPFEFAFRLVNMFSLQGDTVCDPFFGTGTTGLAAMASGRHSFGLEIDPGLRRVIVARYSDAQNELNRHTGRRYEKHLAFVAERTGDSKRKSCAYLNAGLDAPVMTSQETDLRMPWLEKLEFVESRGPAANSSSSVRAEESRAETDSHSGQNYDCPGFWRASYREFKGSGGALASGEIGKSQTQNQTGHGPEDTQSRAESASGLKAFVQNNDPG